MVFKYNTLIGMINFKEAKKIAENKLLEIQSKSNLDLALYEEETIEFEYGWVFFYQSKNFIQTSNPLSMVGGNAPLLVDKYDGSVLITGTKKDIEYYIELYTKFKKEWLV